MKHCQGDECGSMEEFGAPLSVKYSFSNFSFKVTQYLKKFLAVNELFLSESFHQHHWFNPVFDD